MVKSIGCVADMPRAIRSGIFPESLVSMTEHQIPTDCQGLLTWRFLFLIDKCSLESDESQQRSCESLFSNFNYCTEVIDVQRVWKHTLWTGIHWSKFANVMMNWITVAALHVFVFSSRTTPVTVSITVEQNVTHAAVLFGYMCAPRG